jgi:hypothetical protein
MGKVTAEIKLADEVWIATALLHREHPEASDFTLREIVARMVREGFGERKGIYPHVSSHCVANRPGSTGNYRTLFETAPARRRLYRTGDPYDQRRERGKIMPRREEIPPRYHPLLDWYEQEWASASTQAEDPVRALRRKYPDLWRGVDPDEDVRQLREGWE